MSEADVTVVVATYNRPAVLAVVLRAALAHRPRVATVLVVGDSCDGRTALVCEATGDSRVHYVNLAERFGEQSGPNSVGMHLARTEYVAFLNQDDIWLDGHLADALAALRSGRADLFLGRAAFAYEVHVDDRGRTVPRFEWAHPEHRTWEDAFRSFRGAEPASAWVFRRDLLERVGPWKQAGAIWRSPIQDWMLRARRAGVRMTFGSRVTVLKVTTHTRRGTEGPFYHAPSPEHAGLVEWIEEVGVEEVQREMGRLRPTARSPRSLVSRGRALFRREGVRALAGGVRWAAQRAFTAVTGSRIAARIFVATGLDAHTIGLRLLRRPPGRFLAVSSTSRTGAPAPEAPDLDDVLLRLSAGPSARRHVPSS